MGQVGAMVCDIRGRAHFSVREAKEEATLELGRMNNSPWPAVPIYQALHLVTLS